MSTTSEPHLACHHTGYEFDWWRCKERGHVGRPPSPFPASFETSRGVRIDSADSRHGIWALTGTKGNGAVQAGTHGATNNGAGTPNATNNGAGTHGAGHHNGGSCSAGKHGDGTCDNVTKTAGLGGAFANVDTFPTDENIRYTVRDDCSGTHRLFWPIYKGPALSDPVCGDDLANIDTSGGLEKRSKKTPRLAHKRPPWVPTKMPNKWGVAGYPPPYTNYCKETLFNTNTVNPGKVTIRTTF